MPVIDAFGQLAADPGGRFIYALSPAAKTVSVFAIGRSTGTLSAVAGSPFATGPNPTFMRPGPSGRYLLVADPGSLVNNGTDAIWIYTVNRVTGALTPTAGSPFATQGPNSPDVIAVNQVSPKSFATLDNPYSNTRFRALGGKPPYAWSTSGLLPPGLSQNAQTGAITGTPTQQGTFDFTVKVTDAAGAGASRAWFIKVDTCVLPGCPGYIAGSVVEFYNTALDNFFITGNATEQLAVAHGAAGAGWSTTGHFFRGGGPAQVCRFYGSLAPGPNSHFYTVDPVECQALKSLQATTPVTQKRWNFESNDFFSSSPVNGQCASGRVPVYRAYNNGFARAIDSNHRISANHAAYLAQIARGWTGEGIVMCAPAN